MHNKLGDLALILSGYHFRERLGQDPDGDVAVVQMKDVGEGQLEPTENFVRVRLPDVPGRAVIQDGDLILRARGRSYSAVLARGSFGRTVVAAPLALIRAEKTLVLPGYLAWLINHPAIQAQLAGLATGTHVRTVSKAELESLSLPVPPIQRQKTMVEFAALAAAEQTLLSEISASHKRLAEGILWQYAQDAR